MWNLREKSVSPTNRTYLYWHKYLGLGPGQKYFQNAHIREYTFGSQAMIISVRIYIFYAHRLGKDEGQLYKAPNMPASPQNCWRVWQTSIDPSPSDYARGFLAKRESPRLTSWFFTQTITSSQAPSLISHSSIIWQKKYLCSINAHKTATNLVR
jgi:hypothetical protein